VTAFVLLHGSFHGPWCWDEVAASLVAAGHGATAPELRLDPGVRLSDHVAETATTLSALPSAEIVLVGHSYGAMLLASLAAADERVTHCVYVDGFVPAAGETAFDLLGPMGAQMRDAASADPDRCFAPPPPELFGVTDPAVIATLAARLVPMPIGTHDEAPPVAAIDPVRVDRWTSQFMRCTRFPAFEAQEMRAREAGWDVVAIDADHEVMLTAAPALVAALTAGR
jgi:pimeloyl-ACP methyl ester carboxylesterase